MSIVDIDLKLLFKINKICTPIYTPIKYVPIQEFYNIKINEILDDLNSPFRYTNTYFSAIHTKESDNNINKNTEIENFVFLLMFPVYPVFLHLLFFLNNDIKAYCSYFTADFY